MTLALGLNLQITQRNVRDVMCSLIGSIREACSQGASYLWERLVRGLWVSDVVREKGEVLRVMLYNVGLSRHRVVCGTITASRRAVPWITTRLNARKTYH